MARRDQERLPGDQVLDDFYDSQVDFHHNVKRFIQEMEDYADDLSGDDEEKIREFLIPYKALLDNPFADSDWDGFSQSEKVDHLVDQFSSLPRTTTMDSYAYLLSDFEEFRKTVRKLDGKNSDLLPFLDRMKNSASANMSRYSSVAKDFIAATPSNREARRLSRGDMEVANSRAKFDRIKDDMPVHQQHKLAMAVRLKKARKAEKLTKKTVIDAVTKLMKKRQSEGRGIRFKSDKEKALQEAGICNLILGILNDIRISPVEKTQKLRILINAELPEENFGPTNRAMLRLRERSRKGERVTLLELLQNKIGPFLLQERVALAASRPITSLDDHFNKYLRRPQVAAVSISSSWGDSSDEGLEAKQVATVEQDLDIFPEDPRETINPENIEDAALALAKGKTEEAENLIGGEPTSPDQDADKMTWQEPTIRDEEPGTSRIQWQKPSHSRSSSVSSTSSHRYSDASEGGRGKYSDADEYNNPKKRGGR